MTLCVAAECRSHKKVFNSIVFATDFKVEGEIASAEIGNKLATVSRQEYPVLMAGTQTRALALKAEVAKVAELNLPPLDEEHVALNWEPILSTAVLSQKRNLADELVGSRFGITYKQFLEIGKEKFPNDIFRDTIAAIADMSLDCWLMVLGFEQTDPNIYRINSSGAVETCEHFAAIGSGAFLAEGSLFQRGQNAGNDLGTTIYNVFEAMALGSIAPGVGKTFRIGIAEWKWYSHPNPHNKGSVEISFLSNEYYSYLEKRFTYFGPKPVKNIKFKPRFVYIPRQAVVLTPKGELDPEIQKKNRASKAAREREARKRSVKRSVRQRSEDQP